MKKAISVLLIFAMILLLSSCGNTAGTTKASAATTGGTTAATTNTTAAAQKVRIAFVGPQTGDNAEYGKIMKAGVQVAIDEWNSRGGVLGRTIVMDSFDDKNDSQEAGTIAQKIVSDKGYAAVIGHFSSGVAMTAANIYKEAGIALVNGSAAHVDFTGIGDNIFRNNAIYTVDAASALQIIDKFGYKKYASLQPNSDAGRSISKCLKDYHTKYKTNIITTQVAEELFEDGTVDFSSIINKFQQAGAEVIYSTAAYSIVAPFIKQYKAINPKMNFVLSAGTFSQEFLNLVGSAANGAYLPTSFFYESSRDTTKKFTEAFKKYYGSNPNTFAAQTYDGANMIFLAIEAGKSAAPADIVKNLYKVVFEGAAGKTQFDAEGNCPKEQVCLQIVDGKWVEVPNVIKSLIDWEKSMK